MTELYGAVVVALAFILALVLRLALSLALFAALILPVVLAIEAWPRMVALFDRARDAVVVEGLTWRARSFYARGHTWARRRWPWRRVRVGVDAVAARLVPSASAVELPRPGALVHRGEVVAELVWKQRHLPVLSPVEGTVVRVNSALARRPALSVTDPYGRGWLFAVAPGEAWQRGLRRGAAAREWFALEARRLARSFEKDLGLAAADGGRLVEPPAALLDDERWNTLARTFLDAA